MQDEAFASSLPRRSRLSSCEPEKNLYCQSPTLVREIPRGTRKRNLNIEQSSTFLREIPWRTSAYQATHAVHVSSNSYTVHLSPTSWLVRLPHSRLSCLDWSSNFHQAPTIYISLVPSTPALSSTGPVPRPFRLPRSGAALPRPSTPSPTPTLRHRGLAAGAAGKACTAKAASFRTRLAPPRGPTLFGR